MPSTLERIEDMTHQTKEQMEDKPNLTVESEIDDKKQNDKPKRLGVPESFRNRAIHQGDASSTKESKKSMPSVDPQRKLPDAKSNQKKKWIRLAEPDATGSRRNYEFRNIDCGKVQFGTHVEIKLIKETSLLNILTGHSYLPVVYWVPERELQAQDSEILPDFGPARLMQENDLVSLHDLGVRKTPMKLPLYDKAGRFSSRFQWKLVYEVAHLDKNDRPHVIKTRGKRPSYELHRDIHELEGDMSHPRKNHQSEQSTHAMTAKPKPRAKKSKEQWIRLSEPDAKLSDRNYSCIHVTREKSRLGSHVGLKLHKTSLMNILTGIEYLPVVYWVQQDIMEAEYKKGLQPHFGTARLLREHHLHSLHGVAVHKTLVKLPLYNEDGTFTSNSKWVWAYELAYLNRDNLPTKGHKDASAAATAREGPGRKRLY